MGTRKLKQAKQGTQSFGSRSSNGNHKLMHRNQYVIYFKRGQFVRRKLKEAVGLNFILIASKTT